MRKILKRLRHCTWEKQDKIKYSFFPVSSPCRQSLSGQDTTLLSQFSTLFPPGVAGGIHPCGASRCRSLCIPAGIMNYIFLFQPSIDYNIFYYLHKKRERERGESVGTTYKLSSLSPSSFACSPSVLSHLKRGMMEKKRVKKRGFWCDLHINNQSGSSLSSLYLPGWALHTR